MKKYTSFLFVFLLAIMSVSFVKGADAQSNLPAGCTSTVGYSPLTGIECDTVINTSLPAGCTTTVGYSPLTGTACNTTVNTSFPPGCNSVAGYSSTTGMSCSSYLSQPIFPAGCSSYAGYSSTTGNACNTTTSTTTTSTTSTTQPQVQTIVTPTGTYYCSVGACSFIPFSNTSIINSLVIATQSVLPSAQVGQAYSTNIAVTGGSAPYGWGVPTGSILPAGLQLSCTVSPCSSSSLVSGTPTVAGTYNFTLQVYPSSQTSQVVSKQFTLIVNPASTSTTSTTNTIPTFVPPNAQVGQVYSVNLAIAGGYTSYEYWGLEDGSSPLPPGLSASCGGTSPCQSSSLVISGTPTVAGTYNFIIQVYPSSQSTNNTSQPINQPFTLIVNPASGTSSTSTTTQSQIQTIVTPTGTYYCSVGTCSFVPSTTSTNTTPTATYSISATQNGSPVSGSSYQLGDSFTISLASNQPNKSVYLCSNRYACVSIGQPTTDASGNWSYSGTWLNTDAANLVGSWSEWIQIEDSSGNLITQSNSVSFSLASNQTSALQNATAGSTANALDGWLSFLGLK